MKTIALILMLLLCGACIAAEKDDQWIAPLVENSVTFKKAKLAGAKNGVQIIWHMDGESQKGKVIYIGEDVGDHTNRIATLRIQKNGKIEVHTFDSKGEDLWTAE